MKSSELKEYAKKYLSNLIISVTKLPEENILPNISFEHFGIDSMMILNLNKQLEKDFGQLSKTLFFEYENINNMAEYFVENHTDRILSLMNVLVSPPNVGEPKQRFLKKSKSSNIQPMKQDEDDDCIAIIGVSGKYPMADTLEQFWENLKDGKDCITEIPKERWDYNDYYDTDKNRKDKVYTKWGGFINDIDKFDPMFFNMSKRESVMIDPAERLFLETSWKVFEDAGYSKRKLENSNTGVFVGIMYGQYQMYVNNIDRKSIAPTSSYASVANRVSYFFNLHGPSMSVDSMCSSSLTAFHLACESIRHGECEQAIAGGVNVCIHPAKYIILSQQRYASTDGKCRTFGEGGDGYVPGEGVGAVLLKSLKKAKQDKDPIYAIVKSSTINHGGKTNGYTVPNPNAQAALIAHALEKADINPETISYLEAHGTGTSLGDPIEITGLVKAFTTTDKKLQHCAIGSVKSNIGHCEAAAGIAAITKVLLQMKYKTLVPSINSDKLNCNINFTSTPFYVQHITEPWKHPIVNNNEYPRRAGISAFGAGGNNVHVILEEYNDEIKSEIEQKEQLILLSDQDQERLQTKVKQLLHALRTVNDPVDKERMTLQNIAYTLQLGREEMEQRMAFTCSSIHELINILEKCQLGNYEEVFYYDASNNMKRIEQLLANKDDIEKAERAVLQQDLRTIAELWVQGYQIEFDKLNKRSCAYKISLPSYEFKKERCWVDCKKSVTDVLLDKQVSETSLHPFIDYNLSTIFQQKYRKEYRTNEIAIKDHIVSKQYIVAGAVLLETARAAGTLASGKLIKSLQNVMWAQPVVLDNDKETVYIDIIQESNGLAFEISSDNVKKEIYVRGILTMEDSQMNGVATSTYEIKAIKSRCTEIHTREEIEARLRGLGFDYGESYLLTESIYCGEWEALAEMSIPDELLNDKDDILLKPTILDCAFRSALGIKSEMFNEEAELSVPYELEKIEFLKPISQKCMVYAYIPDEQKHKWGEYVKCNVFILDENGEEAIRITGFHARKLKNKKKDTCSDLLYYSSKWKKEDVNENNSLVEKKNVLVLCNSESIINELIEDNRYNYIFVMEGEEFRKQSERIHVIDFSNNDTIDKVVKEYISVYGDITYIINMWNYHSIFQEAFLYSNSDDWDIYVEKLLEKGFYAGIHLFKLFSNININEKIHYISLYEDNENRSIPTESMISSAAKSTIPINNKFIIKTVQIASEIMENRAGEVVDRMINQFDLLMDESRFTAEEIFSRKLYALPNRKELVDKITLKQEGTYVITGGLGGLGYLFATYIAKTYQSRLVLVGRTEMSEDQKRKIYSLKQYGSDVSYCQCNVTDLVQVNQMIQTSGEITGIIHCAGIMNQTSIMNSSKADIKEVLAPKLYGTMNLDLASKDHKLEFFILFSSVSSIVGDYGCVSYASANKFLDEYANLREELREKNQRLGKTISINWPLWNNGGMELPDGDISVMYHQYSGMEGIDENEGLEAFEYILKADCTNVMVLKGNKAKIEKALKIDNACEKLISTKDSYKTQLMPENQVVVELKKKTESYLKNVLAKILETEPSKINENDELEKYGIDSIVIMDISTILERDFGQLPKTLFFEFRTLAEVSNYFIENHRDKLNELFRVGNEEIVTQEVKDTVTELKNEKQNDKVSFEKDDIAIIGISGRFPESETIEQYWENLKNGKDCITVIPKERWDNEIYYSEDKKVKGSIYTKWGGFLKDIDKFDSIFFNIAPREAETMDPQERIFLETAYHAIENAGYTRDSLSGQKVGVFAGAMYAQYQLFGMEEEQKGNFVLPESFFSNIANRVSYYMNFTGPSLTLDTACSSSLETIRLACLNIQNNECEMAIAGGVNLSIHPRKYQFLCAANFLSTDGHCRSFGEGGDGYVPGEGVGAVLLKPLKKAQKDGDYIYGVIKGYGTNHGGKTNGYSVPNPNAQAEVISEAIRKANIPLETISYIECHGTGTSLGDPVEILGLEKAFKGVNLANESCAIGSVKSNIGHLESAAGISGIIKILLQMQHKKLVKSLHSEILNPFIDFDASHFKVQQSYKDWEPAQQSKRRALISSFGAGGTNVSLVLEECERDMSAKEKGDIPYAIVLSAKNKECLKEYASNLLWYLNKTLGEGEKRNEISLENVAFTLQNGRDAMNERLSFVVSSIEEVTETLQQFIYGKQLDNKIFVGTSNKNSDEIDILLDGEEGKDYIEHLIQNKQIEKLAKLWVRGLSIPWEMLYGANYGMRVPLPGYPFAKERYWIKVVEGTKPAITQKKELDASYELLLYNTIWEECNLNDKSIDVNKKILIVGSNTKCIESDLEALRSYGLEDDNCICLTYGDEFQRINKSRYIINKKNGQDYVNLFRKLKDEYNLPELILFLKHVEETEQTNDNSLLNNDQELEDGIYSVYHMVKAISDEDIKNKINIAYVYEMLEGEINPYAEALFGYSLSLNKAYKNLEFLTVLKKKHKGDNSLLYSKFLDMIFNNEAYHYKVMTWEKEHSYIKNNYRNVEEQSLDSLELMNKVWMITGGFGCLGLIIAKHLSRKYNSKIALLGRSKLNDEMKQQLKQLREEGMEVIYISADVTDPESIKNAIAKIKNIYGEINDVIHAAGMYNDQLLMQKDFAQFEKFLTPKIKGSIILDRELAKENLDAFIMFSSLSAVLGDFGQCDYSIGNCFLTSVAAYREGLRKQGLRKGKTIAINWPLWRDGGMHGGDGAEELYLKTSGMSYLETEAGIQAFDRSLGINQTEITVVVGERNKLDRALNFTASRKTIEEIKVNRVEYNQGLIETESMEENFLDVLKGVAAQIIHLDKERLDENENFGEFGFDSISLKEFAAVIEKEYGVEVLPTVFYSYSNLKDLSKYLLDEYGEDIKSMYYLTETERMIEQKIDITHNENLSEMIEAVEDSNGTEEVYAGQYIAIVGADGVFPQSNNLEEFWTNLNNEKDLVTEIPNDRWDLEGMYSPDKNAKNKSLSKWGGFIEDVDKFDAPFFNISPREAELMDPQQRLFLQSVWKTIEDAGYKASSLSGKEVGVFVGAQFNDYQNMLWDELKEARVQIPVGNMLAMLSNRVSYYLNFKGPSEVINTACSSSLVAIHRAVEAIIHGECEMAIAGGVSLSLSPLNYIMASKLDILSADGKCKTFDASANGFVKGEGLGSILLKPLKEALKDRDNIYAVIRATSEKHGGKASSVTAPDSESQASLIVDTYKKAGLNPDTITYVETHGTGTELGDPIEVDGLKKAFLSVKNKMNYCGLGSVKTNIGHLEPAAGMASIMKVLMSMKYEMLPASLHFKTMNPYIKLENSPFYIVDKTKKWNHLKDENGNDIPLRAGISSFGFGGTNVHMVLEKINSVHECSQNTKRSRIFVFSAKDRKCLLDYSTEFMKFLYKNISQETRLKERNTSRIQEQQLCQLIANIIHMDEYDIEINDNLFDIGFDPVLVNELVTNVEQKCKIILNASEVMNASTLSEILELMKCKDDKNVDTVSENLSEDDIAYTLQTGREEMNERLAIVANNLEELYELLKKYKEGEQVANIYTGNINNIKLSSQESKHRMDRLKTEMLDGCYCVDQVAKQWTEGISIDWTLCYDRLPYKISLPTYSFAKNRYWIPKKSSNLLSILEQLQKGKINVAEADELIIQARQ